MEDIYPAAAEQYEELVGVWESSVRATHHFLSEADIVFYRDSLRTALPDMEVYCLMQHGRIAGFVSPEEGMVHALFVRPEFRRQGVGRALMEFSIREKGISRVDVNEQNQEALRFYEQMGFEVFARRDLDGAGKPYPLLLLQLPERSRSH